MKSDNTKKYTGTVNCLLLVIMLLMATPSLVQADTLELPYKNFYNHVRKLSGEDTRALQFAFGFMNINTNRLCNIKSARISTDKKQIPIVISAESRFTLVSEKALRLADAVVVVDLLELANLCDMSVQLETKPEYVKTSYKTEELTYLYQQYQAFFNEIGSFMSFLMPQVDGLNLHFTDKNMSVPLPGGLTIKHGMLSLDESQFNKLNNIKLPSVPLRITAKTSK